MRRLLLSTAAAALAGLTLACGGGGGSDSAQMEQTMRNMVSAFNDGRGDKMYDLMSKSCQSSTTKEKVTKDVAAARAILTNVKMELTKFEVVQQKGDEATVRSTIGLKNAPAFFRGVKPEPEESEMVKEGGKWKTNDCDGLGGLD